MNTLSLVRGVAVSVCLFAVAGLATPSHAEPLEGAVRASLGNAKLDKVRVGVAVVDCGSREVLASVNAGELFAPASNLKLITSGVALTILKDFEFKTGFSVSPTGALIIKGAGDPALCDPKLLEEQGWSVERFIARIVDAARAAKVSGITEVIVDDRVFERDTTGGALVHNSWPKDQLNLSYCAPVGGLNFYTNVIEVRATPGEKAGMKPNVTSEPSAPWLLNLDLSAARTVRDGSNSLWAQQDNSGGGGSTGFTFKIFGDVKMSTSSGGRPQAPTAVNVTVAQPGMLFAKLIAHAFWEAGLTKGGGSRGNGGGAGGLPVRIAAEGEDLTATQAAPFAVITTPLAAAMKRCNVDSQNLYAECLLKRTAFEVTQQPGSWSTGSQVVTMRLTEKLGQEAQHVRIVDGSGLSKDNQVSPMVLARWLTSLQQDRSIGASFLASMDRADTGVKISKRFADRKLSSTVYAKTGMIKNVQCLSGYVVRGDRVIAFSVLANEVGGSGQKVKDFHEEVVVVIDKWLSRQGVAAGHN